MKIPIYNPQKNKTGERELPLQFQEEFRPDLISRALGALESRGRQAYGATPESGLRHSTYVSKRRKEYRGCYGFGISRVARKILSRRGTRMFWIGSFSPQTRGGHRSHPPKAEKILWQKINQKEKQKALRSAIAATINKEIVEKRGHQFPKEYPFVLDSSFEKIEKTKELKKALIALGFEKELERTSFRRIRAGRGKQRGRKYVRKKGILLVTGSDCALVKSCRNLPGVDVAPLNALNVKLLAPGAKAGRVTLWTDKALEKMNQEKLFFPKSK